MLMTHGNWTGPHQSSCSQEICVPKEARMRWEVSAGIDGGEELDCAQIVLSSTWPWSAVHYSELLGIVTLPAGKDESLVSSTTFPGRKIIQESTWFWACPHHQLPGARKNMETVLHLSTLKKCSWESRPKITNDLTLNICAACQKSRCPSPWTLGKRRSGYL